MYDIVKKIDCEVFIIEKSLYLKLSETLIDEIENNYEVGEMLPSERKLGEIYDVSRTTVRLALNDLERKGYISRQHGKGSFVVDHHKSLVNLGEMYSFTEQMHSDGKVPKTTLLDFRIVENNEKVMEIFNKDETTFIKLTRLRSADNTPMLYEETYIPYQKFSEITTDDLNQRSLYNIFKEDYNEIVKLAREEFSAGLASVTEADNLNVKENSPVLEVYRTTLNQNNKVIEYTESKARPDKFSYRTIHYNYIN